jgi:hypothetical protein
MSGDNVIIFVFFAVIILIIIFAWKFEKSELTKLEHRKNINDVPPNEVIPHLQELACFNFSEGVSWRRTVIGTFISLTVLWILLRPKMKFDVITLISMGVVILSTFTVLDMFRNFHINRVICKKATPNSPWFKQEEEA